MPSPPKPPSTRPLKPAKEASAVKSPSAKKKSSSARVSAACEACKKRKTKCSGGPSPCQLCETLGTDCIIDLSLDMRRKAAFQRTIDESRNYQEALNTLLDAIREGPSPRLEALFDYVRSGATNQEITVAVQHQLSRPSDEDGDGTMLSQADGVDSVLEDTKPGKSPADMSSFGSDAGRGRPAEPGLMPVSTLLFSLKNCSEAQGEALLRQFVAFKAGGKASLPSPLADGKSSGDATGPGTSPPSVAERATWHPVLHIRSQSSRAEPHPQFTHFEPPSRRFSEGGPSHIDHSQTLHSDSPSPATASSRQSSRYPMLNTDISLSALTVASSPATPYFELVTNFPSGQVRQNEWDLCVAQEDHVTRLRIPRHLILPLVVPDDSPMSRTYTDYLFGARRMLESGVPASDVLGHSDRVAVDLFFRPRRANDKLDCASWACEVSRSYDTDVFVRLATACLLTHMMRWHLVPTQENYQRIPDMMKPTPTQCMIPHIGAIETIPLPPVRDAATNKLRDWLTPLIEAEWSVNWPHSVEMAVERDSSTGGTVLTQRFHDHVTRYDNWSVAGRFLSAFPEVAGQIRLHEDG
ncbi:hypothetical protein A1O7_09976 [Cladophialophora yegresii CBS 114405]|uniref:Zn(2)-C6 fungal-type domain-containing protein n=1 Tax=Cladophialophora yegresii CBS 114405 TaxID=1182544 RepID=W9VNQ0_9EURO|nr:uncharacterized protein A1O7_09976 [Cladophialophora yegresii CBS 114405]EXJ54635.1 hypothetical protein A1O7_09976 [Cladophialophora yegresii CBS 114405]